MTSALMSIGTRAMFANYAALQTTGNNIANANVDGYSRQQVELSTASGQFTGAGFFGKGVDVDTVTRAHDAFLTREATRAASVSEMDRARFEQLQRLEGVFPLGEAGIGHATNEFLNAMADLASRPQDASARQVVLARAADVAARYADAGGRLDTLQAGVTQDLKASVAQANELAARVAQLNQQIASALGSGHTPNDLLDQRDRVVAELGQHVQLTTIPADDGTLGVFVAGGQRLVLGNQASKLQVATDPMDTTRAAVGIVENGTVRTLDGPLLGGGRIAGLLRFQNDDLAAARNLLGQMAVALAGSVNAQQALGLDARQPPGAGAAIFAAGTPQALAATSNQRDASGNYLASVALDIVDPSQVQAAEYDFRPDPATSGNYLLTRRSDGLVRSIASGDVVDGVRITVGTPAPAATDRFLLQPVTRAATAMQRVLDDPRGVAAASPLSAAAVAGNTGTASVASLRMVSTAANPQLNATVAFTSGTGAYTWELRDRDTDALVSSGTGTWTAGSPITINGAELSLNGVPASGDAFTIGKTVQPAGNNGNALAFVALRDAALVGRTLDGGGSLVGGDTFTDAYASALGDIGVRVQGARTASEISAQVASDAESDRAGNAGVNLDEEAARLIQFQQSYQAAAKVLQVAQSIFDTLLRTAGS
jgi:flagellar hook-associated protein 1 FlgK